MKDYAAVREALDRVKTFQELGDLAVRVDSAFLAGDLKMADEDWERFTQAIGDKARQYQKS